MPPRKKIEPQTVNPEAVGVEINKFVEPKLANLLTLVGIGNNDAGQIGVYVVTYDVANKAVTDTKFIPETGPTEAVERFKIAASSIFMNT